MFVFIQCQRTKRTTVLSTKGMGEFQPFQLVNCGTNCQGNNEFNLLAIRYNVCGLEKLASGTQAFCRSVKLLTVAARGTLVESD